MAERTLYMGEEKDRSDSKRAIGFIHGEIEYTYQQQQRPLRIFVHIHAACTLFQCRVISTTKKGVQKRKR